MLEHRSSEKEIMDDLSFTGKEMDNTLHELRIINKWLGGNAVTLSGIKKLLFKENKEIIANNIRIADLGCGGGDMLLVMQQWAHRNNLMVEFVGIDANEYIINYAKQHAHQFPNISYQSLNVFSADFALQKFDIITCTLFCHHFTEEELLILFKQLKGQSNIGIVINDLHRHWLAYHSIGWLTKLFSKSPMVKNDAKLSVHRGFLKHELYALLAKSGFTKIKIKWKWAFRFEAVAWS